VKAQAGDAPVGWQQAPLSVISIHDDSLTAAHLPYALYHVLLNSSRTTGLASQGLRR